MPIVGEYAWTFHSGSITGDIDTTTWDIRFPPSRGIVKVFLSQYVSHYEVDGLALPFIQSIRTRLPDGTDQQIDFPVPFSDPYQSNEPPQVWSSNNLSGFVVGMVSRNSSAAFMVVWEIWG